MSIVCEAPEPACKALKALQLLTESSSVSFTLSQAKEPTLTATKTHPLTNKEITTTLRGWTPCARFIARQNELLWPNTVSTAIEGWLDMSAAQLLSNEESEQDSKSVSSFADELESHLKTETYLVGDTPTAADVCVALWFSMALEKHSVDLASNTQRWLSRVLRMTSSLTQELGLAFAHLSLKEDETESSPDNVLVAKLVEWQIPHQVYNHEECKTAEELVEKVPIPSNETHTKNLFLKDKKHGMFYIVIQPSTHVNTKALGKMLGLEGKVNMRMADATLLKQALGANPGCLGPLAIVNDTEGQVTLVIEQALLIGNNFEKIHSHPLDNTVSVSMTPKAMQDYFTKAGREVVLLDFSVEAAPSGGGGGKPKQAAAAPKQMHQKKTAKKGETLLALQWKKEENFAQWYSDVIVLSEMISYYDISGCYILRPWSFKVWELMQQWFNKEIGKMGVENCYFPLFVSQDRLQKEKDHVEGFAPEVAWVTKSGEDDLAKHIAIRPTSETIMYPAFAKWIKSHRDLPLKINQWSNVVRWEFKDPTPFLRSREFLWQEGHTAHATFEEANEMVLQGLDLYKRVYEDLLAVPVVPGYKTEKEKFAGGYQTTTVEAYVAGSGRAIQGATSHNLGQNFGKMFEINFQDEKGDSQVPWQTSWGLTTRTIGVMIMVHGDDTGLVLPPRVAPLQVVIVPIISKKLSLEQANPYCEKILEDLKSADVRVKYDNRDIYNPGWKYNHWEQKGVPIRIEVGPRDIEQKQARVVLRYNGEKIDMAVDTLASTIPSKLEEIQTSMFQLAKTVRDKHLVQITEWKDFVPNLELNNLVLTPWCGGEHTDWEEWVKEKSREESLQARGGGEEDERTATSVAAKTLCIPFEQPPIPEGTKCIASDIPATCWILWGRSY